MATPNTFGPDSTGEEVAAAFAGQIRGKIVLITGVSPGGIGAKFAEIIATHQPKLLILAARDLSKAEATAQTISSASPDVKTRVLQLDLSSQAQVRKAAAEVNAYAESIDVLVNNAGVMACPYSTTVDGLESQFGTNHIGHFLFANLIMNKILAAAPGARVVSVSSYGHRNGSVNFEDVGFSGGEKYEKWQAYGQSKTANILFAVAIAEKLGKKGVLAYSLHPGAIFTNLARSLPKDEYAALEATLKGDNSTKGEGSPVKLKTLSQGTATHIVAAFDPSIADHNGGYLNDSRLAPDDVKPYAVDKDNAEKLWKLSEELVGEKFSY